MGTVYAYVWSLLYCWHVEYSTCLLLVHLLPLSLPSLSPSHTNTFVVDSFAHSSWICECDLFLKNLMKSVAWLYFFFFFFQYAICDSLSWNVIDAFAVLTSHRSAPSVPLLESLLPLELNKGTGLSKDMHFWWFVLKLKDYEQDLSSQFLKRPFIAQKKDSVQIKVHGFFYLSEV